ncbi:MAG TPA: hypothetical protein VK179_03350 [Bacteroidales bacterium]|nr:hypothetical protein [Bacteroidales bacterium]
MIGDPILPDSLVSNIGNEPIDFSVKARRAQPLRNSLGLLIFGIVWLAFTSLFVIAFLGPLFQGREVHFEANHVPVVASPDNLKPVTMPSIILGIFVLVGVLMMVGGLVGMFKKGGYFVGTPKRIVHFFRGTIRSIDWEQFSGDIEVSGNPAKGSITLGMRTGRMVSRKGGDRYVPDTLYISEIQDVFNVEKICRQRIKENDPTPVI